MYHLSPREYNLKALFQKYLANFSLTPHLFIQHKVIVGLFNSAKQFALVMLRLTIFRYPLYIFIQSLDFEVDTVHISTLLFTKVRCVGWTILCIARSIFYSCSQAIFTTIGRCWCIAITYWWLNPATARSTALAKSKWSKLKECELNTKSNQNWMWNGYVRFPWAPSTIDFCKGLPISWHTFAMLTPMPRSTLSTISPWHMLRSTSFTFTATPEPNTWWLIKIENWKIKKPKFLDAFSRLTSA